MKKTFIFGLIAAALGFTACSSEDDLNVNNNQNNLTIFPFGQGEAEAKGIGKVKWVQLWENGPRFAEFNVGVTDGKAESYGGYYCWGSSINKDSNKAYKSGTDALTVNDDTATKLWGRNWRMPTQEELAALLNQENCKCTWTENYNGTGVKGLLCTGKGGYSSNSVFLPAAGNCGYNDVVGQGYNGLYWSSTPYAHGNDYASHLDFNSDRQKVSDYYRFQGYSVRAVLVEKNTGTAKATIGSEDVDVNWVQLWENGPKFAEYNVGVTDGKAESYGGYYTWGGTYNNNPALEGFTWTDDHNEGESNLSCTGDNITDTATKLWGSNWRMPTKEEFDNLLAKCDVKWIDGSTEKYNNTTVTGLLCTGKGAYSSNSVFLPAAGNCGYNDVVGQGNYWSSTPNDYFEAYNLYFRSDLQRGVVGFDRYEGYSVRAVLAE